MRIVAVSDFLWSEETFSLTGVMGLAMLRS